MCTRIQQFSILIIAVIFSFQLQAQNGTSHFLVELENRAPSVQDLVKGYEGFPSIPFQANDIKGKQYSLQDLKGKTVFLYFWNLNNGTSTSQMDALNLMQSRYRDKLQIISFADDNKESLISYLKATPIDFPIIPNSKTLSDGPYGGDLGTPKLFIIDEYGIIKWVFPESSFNKAEFNFYNVMETLFKQLNM